LTNSLVQTATAVPKWSPDFHAPIRHGEATAGAEILVQNQELTTPNLNPTSALPSHAGISISRSTTSITLPESAQTPPLTSVNDDEETHPQQKQRRQATTPTKRRKRKSRRKARRNDRRRCRATLTISKKDYEAGRTAWTIAQMQGRPLDTLVTLRPANIDDMTMSERRDWFMGRLKSLGQWFSDNDNRPPFTALWSREARRIGTGREATAPGEHAHILVHAGNHRDALERMLRKSLKGKNEVDVRPATQEVLRLECGWLGDASTYVLKAVNQKVWRSHRETPHRPSGPIYGTRCGWTNNIAPAA
jgi:hypothetical protein